MLDTKYAPKYKMPHSVLHIVDNSAYNEPLPTTVVNDPSLYATLVVTATPIGVDNKIVNLTRADIAAASFGLNSITEDDILRYGQTIEYPMSILENGNAPVRLLRVTPDGSTYAHAIICVQWRIDGDKMHVRFVRGEIPPGLRLDRFKNTDKLNEAIVRGIDKTVTENGLTWSQRVFINAIAAGRGKFYNNFAFAINLGQQAKNPSNCRYLFSTINTGTGVVVEEFAASLSNVTTAESKKYYSTLDDVNTVVSRRYEASSIIVPYLNKKAVNEVYNDYIALIDSIKEDLSDNDKAHIKTLNINIFDMIYGTDIYNGTLYSSKLPHYYVDMYDNDIIKLPTNDIYTVFNNAYDDMAPYPIWNSLYPKTYGVTQEGSSVYVGDTYMSASGSGNTDPIISVVAAINQYTGAVTSVSYRNVYIKDNANHFISRKLDVLVDLKIDSELTTDTGDDLYTIVSTAPADWASSYSTYYKKNGNEFVSITGVAPAFDTSKYYWTTESGGTATQVEPGNWSTNFADYWVSDDAEGEDRTKVSAVAPAFNSVTGGVYEKINQGKVIQIFSANALLKRYIQANIVNPSASDDDVSVIAATYTNNAAVNNFDVCSIIVKTKTGVITNINFNPNPGDVLSVIDFGSVNGGNIIGNIQLDAAYSRVGSIVVQTAQSSASIDPSIVYVNGYDTTYNQETGVTEGTKIYVSNNTNKFGIIPDSVNVDSSILGHQYDVVVYDDDNANNKKAVKTAAPGMLTFEDNLATAFGSLFVAADATSEVSFAVGDSLVAKSTHDDTDINTITFIVDAVDADGKIKRISVNGYSFAPYTGTDWDSDHKTNQIFGDFGAQASPGAEITAVNVVSSNDSAKVAGTIIINHKDLRVTDISSAVNSISVEPTSITRYAITGSTGSLIRIQIDNTSIPENYYTGNFGLNPSSNSGGVQLERGSTDFFDDPTISDIEFKWRYSELLVKAYRGELDPRIMSPVRCPAKYLFDGNNNTIVGQTILPNVTYKPYDIINSSTIFTDDEKEAVLYDNSLVAFVDTYSTSNDIDVKQAMYDLMVYRCYYGMPESMRPIGPGFGLSVHFDAGITDYNTAMLVNESFNRRFNNPNASWDIGGYTDATNGITYTYTKWIADNLIKHCKANSVNKPFVMEYASIPNDRYISFFPDLDVTDWDLRELLYNSGGNAWVPDINGALIRRSQRTMFTDNETSDLLQESNMRTLSKLCYELQNMIDGAMYSYTDEGVLQTLTDLCNNRFSTWSNNLVESLDISFERDINPLDGADLVVCYCNVTFRGLFLRVPIIVNVNRRTS